MLMLMQRDQYNTVTIEILVPASPAEADGETYYEEPVRVRRFTTEDLNRNSTRGKKTWQQIESWKQTEMLNLVDLVRTIRDGDAIATEKALLNLKATRGPIVLGITKALLKEPGFAQQMLVKELSNQLDAIRLVLWRQEERVAPALLCPDVGSALLVRVVMSAVGATAGLRLCPKCGQAFLQKRADQDYCSVKCREAHRVERWRAGKRSEEQSIKGTRKSTKRRIAI
jgi:hypothetical protein